MNVPDCFKTIPQIAHSKLLPEHALRRLQKEGKLPCFYVNTRCYVHVPMLMEKLTTMWSEGWKDEKRN